MVYSQGYPSSLLDPRDFSEGEFSFMPLKHKSYLKKNSKFLRTLPSGESIFLLMYMGFHFLETIFYLPLLCGLFLNSGF